MRGPCVPKTTHTHTHTHTCAALNMAVFLLIGKTSALTMNIAGVVKDWLLIGLSVAIFGCVATAGGCGLSAVEHARRRWADKVPRVAWPRRNPVTLVQLFGYGISFIGVMYYNYMKIMAMKQTAAKVPEKALENGGESSPLLSKANSGGYAGAVSAKN
jgi:hypothetical protein